MGASALIIQWLPNTTASNESQIMADSTANFVLELADYERLGSPDRMGQTVTDR